MTDQLTKMTIGNLSDKQQAVVKAGCDWIDDHETDLLDLLGDLVAHPSLSGEEGTHDDDTVVGRIWDALADEQSIERDAQLLTAEQDYGETPRENVYAVLPGSDDQSGLVCTSHTDVVPVSDESAWPNNAPFQMQKGMVKRTGSQTVKVEVGGKYAERRIRDKMARIWDERDVETVDALFGRGVYDNKASSICLIGSLLGLTAALGDTDKQLGGDLIHGHLVDEEVYQLGVKQMVGWDGGDDWLGNRYDHFDQFAGVVLEGSYGFVPIIGHRGLVWLELRAEGDSAHASTPELGQNAVLGIGKALSVTDTDAFESAISEPFVEDELLGNITVAAGTTIAGGGVTNVDPSTHRIERSGINSIPDWCDTTFDIRIPRWDGFPDGVDAVCKQLCDIVASQAAAACDEISFTAEVVEGFFPPVALSTDKSAAREHPLVQIATSAAQETVGYDPGIDVAPGVTDASFLYNGTHMPTLVEYGPAGALSHEPLEYVERDQVIAGAKAMLRLAVQQLGVVQRS